MPCWNRMLASRRWRRRRGAVIVLVALFLVVIVAMLAFALDIGYTCRVQSELQNAADTAALAAAQEALRAEVRSDSQPRRSPPAPQPPLSSEPRLSLRPIRREVSA